MRASNILVVILAFCSTTASGRGLTGLRSTSSNFEVAAVVPAPFWFSPMIDLVKWIYNGAKLAGNDKKTADSSLKPPMQSEAKTLQQLPPFLSSERDLRKAALDLNALATLMSAYPSVADGEWQRLKAALKQTDDDFKNSYGSKDMATLLQSNAMLQNASKQCKDSLDNIEQRLANTADSASSANKQLAVNNLQGRFDALSTCSQEPDGVVVAQLQSFLDSYQQVSQPQAAPKNGQTQSTARLNTSRSTIVLASFQASPETKQESPVDQGITIYKTQPEYITNLQAKIANKVDPPDWMKDLAQAQSQLPKAPFKPWQAGLEGIVGSLGVAAYSVKRHPNFLRKIGLLEKQRIEMSSNNPQISRYE
jgi:hypothetical protein